MSEPNANSLRQDAVVYLSAALDGPIMLAQSIPLKVEDPTTQEQVIRALSGIAAYTAAANDMLHDEAIEPLNEYHNVNELRETEAILHQGANLLIALNGVTRAMLLDQEPVALFHRAAKYRHYHNALLSLAYDAATVTGLTVEELAILDTQNQAAQDATSANLPTLPSVRLAGDT